jgi:quercetin dioxygenase-like cupin family protein
VTEIPYPTREKIISARGREARADGPAGVDLRIFVSAACGATGFSTGTATFQPGGFLPYHVHGFSEAVTVIKGFARVLIEGRSYCLCRRDCLHVPAGVAHQVQNDDPAKHLLAHWAFATPNPVREITDRVFPLDHRGSGNPSEKDPETIVRFSDDAIYELSKDAFFCDLFARRFGSEGICGGYGRFLPGASLPCHIHDFDESITIVEGSAFCFVQGKQYELSGCDTAFIPKDIPHRFLNKFKEPMAMVWVYAGNEPDRQIVEAGYCSGELAWPN